MKWTHERDLFGLYLADKGVKKMTSDRGQVMLVAWRVVSGKKLGQIEFESAKDYEAWMDAVVSDDDAAHNRARALHCVLRAMGAAGGKHE